MTLQQVLAAVGDGGQILVIVLLVWLVWSKNRDQREAREFQRRMDERTAQLHEWTVRRLADTAMPTEKESKGES
jgi:ABC-type nickel/cobalt efflux system permease component RcnA